MERGPELDEMPSFKEKMGQINGHLQQWFESGQVVFDMGAGFDVQETADGNFTLAQPSFAQIQAKYQDVMTTELPVSGPCRTLTPALAGMLLQLGLISDVRYLIDDVKETSDRILHTAFVAKVSGQDVFFDVARRTPFLKGVPVDGSYVASGTRSYHVNFAHADKKLIRQRVITKGSSDRKTIFWRSFVPEEEEDMMQRTLGLYARNRWNITRADFEDGQWTRKPSLFDETREKAFEVLSRQHLPQSFHRVELIYGQQPDEA